MSRDDAPCQVSTPTCRSVRCSSLLQEEFPDVTISKIRFLESQGLLDPERTPSGYRKFYEADIERLRWILTQQRENFLPAQGDQGPARGGRDRRAARRPGRRARRGEPGRGGQRRGRRQRSCRRGRPPGPDLDGRRGPGRRRPVGAGAPARERRRAPAAARLGPKAGNGAPTAAPRATAARARSTSARRR